MAEGWLRHLFGDRYGAFSAGTEPGRVHPAAIRVMAEAGIDISGQTSKSTELFLNSEFDLVVTLCADARDVCPYFPNARARLHRGFEDPSRASGSEEEVLRVFRRVRDEIEAWIRKDFR
jgi:arsenate reductase